MHSNEFRQTHLFNQIKLQIKRNGIPVVFDKGSHLIYPYFQFDYSFYDTLAEWLSEKYAINIYIKTSLKQIGAITRSNIYVEGNRLYFTDRKHLPQLFHECEYIMAKNNATLIVLSKIYSEIHKIEPSLYEFINEEEISEVSTNPIKPKFNWTFNRLNRSQTQAINKILKNRITFIKGPPGCGKTTTISRICRIFAESHLKVLVGAVSKSANLTIARQLLTELNQSYSNVNVLLFLNKQTLIENATHPPEIQQITLRNKLIENILILNQSYYMPREGIELYLDKFWTNEETPKTFISIYYQAMAKTLHEADVVIVTTVSANKLDQKLSDNQKFKPYIGILDQASQASWADTYCFLCQGIQKFVLSGDQKQLAPTVISQNQILKETMFSTLKYKNMEYFCWLNEQHRMHPAICQFPNTYFYEKKLINAVTEKDRQSDIFYFRKYPLSYVSIKSQEDEYVDTLSGKKNYWNEAEIFVILEVLKLFKAQDYCRIGIISPYEMQIQRIAQALGNEAFEYGLTIRTCDGYQGGEKDYIIVSFVRSNPQGKIGFCGEETRLNVTLTRARKGLIIIGNSQTFQHPSNQSKVWNQYINYLRKRDLILEEEAFSKVIKPQQTITPPKQIPQTMQKVVEKKKTVQFQIEDVSDNSEDEEEKLLSKNKESKKKLKRILSNLRVTKEKLSKKGTFKEEDDLKKWSDQLDEICEFQVEKIEKSITREIAKESLAHSPEGEYMEKLEEELCSLKEEAKQGKQYNHVKEKELIFKIIKARNMIQLLKKIH